MEAGIKEEEEVSDVWSRVIPDTESMPGYGGGYQQGKRQSTVLAICANLSTFRVRRWVLSSRY